MNLTLPRRPDNVARGRDALQPLEPLLGDRYPDARLLVSELLTNAVLHGSGDHMRLKAVVRDDVVRVEVVDGGHGFEPPAEDPPPESTSGRGLRLVDAIADDWGLYEGSTHVWFDVRIAA